MLGEQIIADVRLLSPTSRRLFERTGGTTTLYILKQWKKERFYFRYGAKIDKFGNASGLWQPNRELSEQKDAHDLKIYKFTVLSNNATQHNK